MWKRVKNQDEVDEQWKWNSLCCRKVSCFRWCRMRRMRRVMSSNKQTQTQTCLPDSKIPINKRHTMRPAKLVVAAMHIVIPPHALRKQKGVMWIAYRGVVIYLSMTYMAIIPIQRLAFHRLRTMMDGISKRIMPTYTIERHQRYCTGVNPRSCSRPPNLALEILDLVVIVAQHVRKWNAIDSPWIKTYLSMLLNKYSKNNTGRTCRSSFLNPCIRK